MLAKKSQNVNAKKQKNNDGFKPNGSADSKGAW